MSRAGDRARLEIAVARKSYMTASGAPQEVLRDCAFVLEAGQTGALVGPSGCGKTTLLRIIARLDTDFEGHAHLPGNGRLAMVFQEPRLLPWRTVEDNVRLAVPQSTSSERNMLFEALGLSAHRNHFPGELSLGLARRVALARAFAAKRDLLILDEPFVSLDAVLAHKLRDELAQLIDAGGMTTLIVTHDMDEAISLADRVFVLSSSPARVIGEVEISTPRGAMRDDARSKYQAEIRCLTQPKSDI